MNSGPLLFLGIFMALASSFWGLVLVPQLQLGRQEQVTNPATAAVLTTAITDGTNYAVCMAF
mgnify:CR=1 FL=1